MYRVFLGAPTLSDLDKDPSSYQWQTISSNESKESKQALERRRTIVASQSIILPPATLEAASRRISRIYANVIFDEKSRQGYDDFDENADGSNAEGPGERTTMISWALTADQTGAHHNESAPSFLLDISKSRTHTTSMYTTQFETQETQSYNYSDTSSIANFPNFNFSLHALTSLTSLTTSSPRGSRKINNLLLAVLETDGPNTIRIKKGPDAGKEVSVLEMILGDEDGAVCKLTAWREVADEWGGAVKRGDILFIESVTATWDPSTSPLLTASPHLKSKMEICYRTMPYTHEDNRLRPDLRLGESDAAVRKVAGVVRWFEGMAGLGGG